MSRLTGMMIIQSRNEPEGLASPDGTKKGWVVTEIKLITI